MIGKADYLKSRGWTGKRENGHIVYTKYSFKEEKRLNCTMEQAVSIQEQEDFQRQENRRIELEAQQARKEAEAKRLQAEDSIKHYRNSINPETIAKDEMMEEFMDFVISEFEMSREDISDLQSLVNSFIGYDSKKAEQGEKELLARWTESCKR